MTRSKRTMMIAVIGLGIVLPPLLSVIVYVHMKRLDRKVDRIVQAREQNVEVIEQLTNRWIPQPKANLKTKKFDELDSEAQLKHRSKLYKRRADLCKRKKAVLVQLSCDAENPQQCDRLRQSTIQDVLVEKSDELATEIGMGAGEFKHLAQDKVILSLIGTFNLVGNPNKKLQHLNWSNNVFVPIGFLQKVAKKTSPLIEDFKFVVKEASQDTPYGYKLGESSTIDANEVNQWLR